MDRNRKILIAILEDEVAPRFDLATEVLIAVIGVNNEVIEERTVVLPRASSEDLCYMVLAEGVDVVICGGIEEEYYQYLVWKKVTVFDSVMGPWRKAMSRWTAGRLASGAVLFDRQAPLPMPGA